MNPPELRLTRMVPASVEDVFRAWTDPEVLARWWGPGDHTVTDVELDAQLGGRYRLVVATPEGGTMIMVGIYVEFDPPHRLSFTWNWEAGGVNRVESRVTVELRPAGEATELVLWHGGFPDEAVAAPYRRGWDATLPKLLALFD